MLRIGPYQLDPVETSPFALDGGAMFGIVPKPLWSRENPADERNRIPLAARALLLRGLNRVILVDCGLGPSANWKPREREIYQIAAADGLRESLGRLGVKAESVTDLVLTHLHFDHAGGLTELIQGEWQPSFPAATVYLQRRGWEQAHAPSDRERGSYLPERFAAYGDGARSGRKLTLIDGAAELFPGVTVHPSHGHTPGMQVVRVAAGTDSLLYTADLIPTSAHLKPHWLAAYDLEPVLALAEKREWLERAAAERAWIFYEHDPKTRAERIAREEIEGRVRYRPIEALA